MKKFTTIALSAICLLGAVGCTPTGNQGNNGDDPSDEGYKEKTVLYVYNYNAGFGSRWLDPVIERFEEAYKDYSFEEGKKGVHVEVDAALSGSSTLQDTIKSASQDIFFTEGFLANRYLSTDSLLDISDIVTEPLTAYGETESIEDKMDEQSKAFYSSNGAYYAVPHYECFNGISYNVDMFEQNLCYFAKNGGFITSLSDERSNGPDGKAGTYDDGLPATYDEFFKVCDRLKNDGDKNGVKITPIGWSGQYQFYMTRLLASLWANHEGADIQMLFDFAGEASDIVKSVSANGTITYEDTTTISNANGYLVHRQEGKYYALTFLERIIKGGYYSNASLNDDTQSHLLAQADFIYSGYTPETEAVAMHIDGSYWYNEASDTFAEMSEYFDNTDADSRRFAYMPLPHATEDKIGTNTLVDNLWSAGMIRSTIDSNKIEAAKKFLQFCYTDVSLDEFTKVTGTTKGVSYELSEETYNSMNCYERSLWDIKVNSNVIKAISTNSIFYNNQESFFFGDQVFNSRIGNKVYNVPSNAMKDDGISAIDYFNGVSTFYSKSSWISSYSNYF